MTTTTQQRVPAGVTTGGQFASSARTESPVELTGTDQWAGCWSVEDFTPDQRAAFDATARHAYDWADSIVGNRGMENSDYAEDYSGWVARRFVELHFDVDALSGHNEMHAAWDAERAAAAAATLTEDGTEAAWVSRMSGGQVLTTAEVGKRGHQDFSAMTGRLAGAGITVTEARTISGQRGWTISRMDGDVFGRQVWVGGQRGPRVG